MYIIKTAVVVMWMLTVFSYPVEMFGLFFIDKIMLSAVLIMGKRFIEVGE